MRSHGQDGDGLAATLYGPSRVRTTIKGVEVSVFEKTGYPFSFDIEFSIETAREVEFPLRLRVPRWSAEPSVAANGAAASKDNRGFIVLSKKWKSGDKVRLTLKPSVHGRTAVNGTTAVAYGPLVFSLPIPEKAEIVQRFSEPGFYGYQYDPADLVSAKRPLQLQAGKPGFALTVVRDKTSDLLHPWDRPPLKLRGEMIGANGKLEAVELLPMGSTLLRRTCFRQVKTSR